MNRFDSPNEDARNSLSDSLSSINSSEGTNTEEVNRLMEELVPREVTPKEVQQDEDDTTIMTCLTKIDSIRQTIKQIDDANHTLEKIIHSYELEQQESQQHTIASIIQRTNQIAAQSRVVILCCGEH